MRQIFIIISVLLHGFAFGIDLEKKESEIPMPLANGYSYLAEDSIAVLNRVGTSREFHRNIRKHMTRQVLARDRFEAQSFLIQKSSVKTDRESVKKQIQTSTSDEAANHIADSLPVIQKLKNGFDFNFGLSSIFGSKASQSVKRENPTPNIKYGLVLEDIEPNIDKKYFISSFGSLPEEELEYAQPANVKWSVKKRGGDSLSNNPFAPNRSKQSTYVNHDKWGFWKKIPTLEFKGNAKPKSKKMASQLLKGESQLPLDYKLSQVEGIYEMTFYTEKAESFIPEDMKQTVSIPIYGTIRVTQTVNDKQKVIQNGLTGLQPKERAPILNLYQLPLTKQYRADLSYGYAGVAYELGYKTDNFNPEKQLRDEKQEYLLKIKSKF